MKTISIVLVLILFGTVLKAQFKVGAEYRIRSEMRDGYRTLSDSSLNPAFVTTQRTRLNFGFTNQKLEVYLSIQDARTWGEVRATQDAPSIGIHQAYVKYSVNEVLAFKLGRQELAYDNKRFLGLKNWNNVPVAHDIAIFQIEKNKTKLHGGFAYNNDSDKLFESDYDVVFYKYLGYLWFNQQLAESFNLSVMNIYDGNQKFAQPDTIYTRGTSGILLNYTKGKFSVDVSSYFQYGKIPDGQSLSAYFFHIKPSFDVTEKLNLALGIDYFSGDDAKEPNDVSNSFSNLYGDGHGYYGHMDYFTSMPRSTKNGGLNDMYLVGQYTLNDKISFMGALHQFMFTNNVLDETSTPTNIVLADKNLGTEIDASFKYKFYSKSDLSIGYSAMFANESMEILKSGESSKVQNWLWVSIQFKPELFSSNTNK